VPSFKVREKMKDIALRSLHFRTCGRWGNHIEISATCTPSEVKILLSLGCKFDRNSYEERLLKHLSSSNRNKRHSFTFIYVPDQLQNFAKERTRFREKAYLVRAKKWKDRQRADSIRSKEREYVRSLK